MRRKGARKCLNGKVKDGFDLGDIEARLAVQDVGLEEIIDLNYKINDVIK
jgi:hypothetical protein